MNQSKGKARPQTSKPKTRASPGLSVTVVEQPRRAKQTVSKQRPKFNPRNLVNKLGSTGSLRLSSSNTSTSRHSQVIEEDEYIAEVIGSVAFATTSYPINPGQLSTFPWGSKVASLYEKYDFQLLEFYYRREVSEYATNGQSGKVMLSCDYDASDSPPTSKQQVLDTVPHVDGMPSKEEIRLRINPSEMRNQDGKFVRPGTQPANTDIKTYDSGNLFVSTYGCANTSTIGELRVRYRCTLRVPVLESAGGGQPGSAGSFLSLSSNLSGEAAAATTVFVAQFASATVPVTIANGIGATVASTGLITLLPGTYSVQANSMSWATTSSVSATTIALTQVTTAYTDVVQQTAGAQTSTNDSLGYEVCCSRAPLSFIWNTTLYGLTLAFQVASTYASGTGLNISSLVITQL